MILPRENLHQAVLDLVKNNKVTKVTFLFCKKTVNVEIYALKNFTFFHKLGSI